MLCMTSGAAAERRCTSGWEASTTSPSSSTTSSIRSGQPAAERDPRVDEAHHRVSAQGFKFYVTEQVCRAAGGPQTTRAQMLDSHRELLISGAEWDAFMDDFHQPLANSACPARARRARRIVEITQDDIATSAAPAAT